MSLVIGDTSDQAGAVPYLVPVAWDKLRLGACFLIHKMGATLPTLSSQPASQPTGNY